MLESEMIGKEGAAPEADTGATHREMPAVLPLRRLCLRDGKRHLPSP